MARVNPLIKERISELKKDELVKLALKAASMSQQVHDYMLVTYADPQYGEKHLFEKAKDDLQMLYRKNHKGYAQEMRVANLLAACNKRISEFSKVCKDKTLEMELILDVLEIPFSMNRSSFRTCFTKFNYQVTLLLKKAVTLLKTKLHPDFHIQYAPTLNEFKNFAWHIIVLQLCERDA